MRDNATKQCLLQTNCDLVPCSKRSNATKYNTMVECKRSLSKHLSKTDFSRWLYVNERKIKNDELNCGIELSQIGNKFTSRKSQQNVAHYVFMWCIYFCLCVTSSFQFGWQRIGFFLCARLNGISVRIYAPILYNTLHYITL